MLTSARTALAATAVVLVVTGGCARPPAPDPAACAAAGAALSDVSWRDPDAAIFVFDPVAPWAARRGLAKADLTWGWYAARSNGADIPGEVPRPDTLNAFLYADTVDVSRCAGLKASAGKQAVSFSRPMRRDFSNVALTPPVLNAARTEAITRFTSVTVGCDCLVLLRRSKAGTWKAVSVKPLVWF